jgi:hypothetical protein
VRGSYRESGRCLDEQLGKGRAFIARGRHGTLHESGRKSNGEMRVRRHDWYRAELDRRERRCLLLLRSLGLGTRLKEVHELDARQASDGVGLAAQEVVEGLLGDAGLPRQSGLRVPLARSDAALDVRVHASAQELDVGVGNRERVGALSRRDRRHRRGVVWCGERS